MVAHGIFRYLVPILTLVLVLAGCGSGAKPGASNPNTPGQQAPKEKQRVSLVTAGTGGAWYPIGGGLADLMNKKASTITVSAEVSQGGIENVRLVHGDKAQFGFVNFDAAYFGYNGEAPFDDGKKDIAGVAALYPSTLQIVVLDNSAIKTVNDLKGKRVVVGPPASSSAVMGYNVLAEYGITKDDIRGLQLTFAEGADALKDGNADALFVASAHPNSVVMDLTATKAIRLVPIAPDMQEKVNQKFGYYGKVNIPKGTYKGQEEDIPTLSLSTMIITNKVASDEIVYDFVRVLYDNLEETRDFHSVMSSVVWEDAASMPIPLHPGAEKYFKEKGLIK